MIIASLIERFVSLPPPFSVDFRQQEERDHDDEGAKKRCSRISFISLSDSYYY